MPKKTFFVLFSFFVCKSLFSYDKINVTSYLSEDSLLNAKYLNVYEDKVYVLTGKKILVYTSTLSYISSLDINSEMPAAFDFLNGNIYMLDSKKSVVSVLDSKSNIVFSFGSYGSQPGQLSFPSDIRAFGDKIYIADTDNSRISVYDKNGIFLYNFSVKSKDGLTTYKPVKISFDPYGNIYIVESKYKTISKYDIKGKFLADFNITDNAIAVNSYGFIYGGGADGKIKEYDLSFSQKGIFGTKGKNKFEFLSFTDIKPYKQGIYVLDSKNKKILYLNIENKGASYINYNYADDDKIYITPDEVLNLSAYSFSVSDKGLVFYNEASKTLSFKKGEETSIVASYGESEDKVKKISSVAWLENKIYALDGEAFKVKTFEDNKYSFSFGDKVGLFGGDKDGRFSKPISVFADSNENISVLDSKLNMVQVFSKDGIFLYSINIANLDKEAKFADMFVDENSNWFLLSLKKIYVINKEGRLSYSIDLGEVSEPVSFSYDGFKYIFVLDSASRVYVFDKKGVYIRSFFSKGTGPREFLNPNSIKYYHGKIYISDPKLSRISSFKINYRVSVKDLSLKYENDSVNISWKTDDNDVVKEFEVMKSTDSNFVSIAKLKDYNYIDKKLISGATSYYKIKSVSSSLDESYSSVSSVFIESKKEEKNVSAEDSKTSKNRPPIEIIPSDLKYIFSANYKYYINNPIGKISVKNNTKEVFENLKVSFFLKEYMDFPYDIKVDSIDANSSREVIINATLNNKILTINENTPVQSLITIEYYSGGERKETTLTFPVKILSKDSIVWDDTRRISNFITSKDPFILQIAKSLSSKRDEFKHEIDPNIITYSLFLNYLSSLGIKYVEDPVVSYKDAKASDTLVDTVQYPRNLLKMKAGDCDDFTALYASLFEAVGVRTVIMDYPDHITLMFETKGTDSSKFGVPSDILIEYNGSYFVPIEVTLLSKSSYDAIAYASSMYKSNRDKVKFYEVREALKIYEPPTLDFKEENMPEVKPDFDGIVLKDLDYIAKKNFEYYENYYKTILNQDPNDIKSKMGLGVLYATFDMKEKAKAVFSEVLESDPNNSPALNNMGNIYMMNSDYSSALEFYDKAYKSDPYDANILLNIAKAYIKLNKSEDAKLFFNKAVAIDPELGKFKEDLFKN